MSWGSGKHWEKASSLFHLGPLFLCLVCHHVVTVQREPALGIWKAGPDFLVAARFMEADVLSGGHMRKTGITAS